ncbi:MAG: choice-of-anchor tandem repeat GloVer-containing protein, partial [Cyclobacteriaceae bacterium]
MRKTFIQQLLVTVALLGASNTSIVFAQSSDSFPYVAPIIVEAIGDSPQTFRVQFVDTNTSEYGYLFYYSTSPEGPFDIEDWDMNSELDSGRVLSFRSNTGYAPNTRVYIKIAALIIDPIVNAPIQASPFTELVSTTTMAGWPLPPTDFTAKAESNQIQLTWTDNSPVGHPFDESAWGIMRSDGDGNFNRSYTVPANTTSFVDSEVMPNQTYYYRLESINQFGNSYDVYFANVTALPVIDTPTVSPSNISFSNVLSTSMTVSFTPGNGTHRLAVMKAGGAPSFKPIDNTSYTGVLGNGESVVYNGKGSTFNFTGLIPNTQYFVTIFEYNSDSTSTRYLVSNAPLASTFTKNTSSLPTLFGMASAGGLSGVGTIFKINVDGSGLGVLHNFNGTNGANPTGSLIQATDGSLWGTTSIGGSFDLGTIFKINADGSGFQVLHNFNNTDGANPNNSLIQATDGSLLGMTSAGGSSGNGTIFKINLDGKGYRVMHNFNGLNGAYPSGSLIQALDGYFYGMTPYGGTWGAGTVFRMDTNGGYVILQHMRGPGEDVWVGANPHGSLIQARDGHLYGMSTNGGSYGCWIGYVGTIFRIYTDGGVEGIYNFDNCNGKGAYPYGSLVQTPDGWMYGMANSPSDGENGTIFKITDTDIPVLHKFNQLNGFNGLTIEGNLIAYNGKLFGFTPDGGQYNSGVIFSYDLANSTYQELGHLNDTTGIRPRFGSLLLVHTQQAIRPTIATSNIVFSEVTNKSINISFTPGNGEMRVILMEEFKRNDTVPVSSSIQEPVSIADGTVLLGNTNFSQASEYQAGWKVVYTGNASSVNLKGLRGATEYRILIIEYNGLGTQSSYLNSDYPVAITRTNEVVAPAVAASNINFSNVLSTTMRVNFIPGTGDQRIVIIKAGSAPVFKPEDDLFYSGNLGNGEFVIYNGNGNSFNVSQLQSNTEYFITIFEFNTDSLTVRYLTKNAPVSSRLIPHTTAKLFGLANSGTMYQINPDGSDFTTMYVFNNEPSGLILGSNGSLFGSLAPDKIFKINPDGSGYTLLHTFNYDEEGPLIGSLIQGSDGSLFGMTDAGGLSVIGTIFKINPDGTGHTVLHSGGSMQTGSLIQGTDGSLFGMTSYLGTIFKINTDGSGYVVLHSFASENGNYNNEGFLIQLSDGSLCGITVGGGSSGQGKIFKINMDGSNYRVIHNFNMTDNTNPIGSLIQASDGSLFGMTALGPYS